MPSPLDAIIVKNRLINEARSAIQETSWHSKQRETACNFMEIALLTIGKHVCVKQTDWFCADPGNVGLV